MPSVHVEARQCIEYVSDKEEGVEDNRGSYWAFMDGSTWTTLNVLYVGIDICEWFMQVDSSYHTQINVSVQRDIF